MSEPQSPLIAQIDADLQAAMRAQDETAKLTLRSVKTALAEAGKAGASDHSLTDEEAMAVLQQEAKRRRDAAREYEQAQRPERAAQEAAELAVLELYLPRQLDENEIRALATEVIAEVNAASMRDMGRVMSAIMPRVAGLADGQQVNQVVRSLLSQ